MTRPLSDKACGTGWNDMVHHTASFVVDNLIRDTEMQFVASFLILSQGNYQIVANISLTQTKNGTLPNGQAQTFKHSINLLANLLFFVQIVTFLYKFIKLCVSSKSPSKACSSRQKYDEIDVFYVKALRKTLYSYWKQLQKAAPSC